jgi:hypothetical protein
MRDPQYHTGLHGLLQGGCNFIISIIIIIIIIIILHSNDTSVFYYYVYFTVNIIICYLAYYLTASSVWSLFEVSFIHIIIITLLCLSL